MNTFPRILVAVSDDDFSKPSMQMAIRLALDQRADLRFAYVSEVVPPQASSAQHLAEIETRVREEGNAILRRVTEQATEQGVTNVDAVRLTIDTVKDSIAQALAEQAETWDASLLITGSHGRKGIARWLAGSVSESLVRVSTVPVLIVRDEEALDEESKAPEA